MLFKCLFVPFISTMRKNFMELKKKVVDGSAEGKLQASFWSSLYRLCDTKLISDKFIPKNHVTNCEKNNKKIAVCNEGFN